MSFLGDLANNVDKIGTAFNLPGYGISEFLNGGKATANTGRVQENGLNNIAVGGTFVTPAIGIGGSTSSGSGSQTGANSGSSNPTSNKITTTYTAGSGGSYGSANDIAQLNQSASTIQNALNRLGSQLGIAEGNVNTQYGQKVNELDTAHATNENSYNTSTTQNQQNFRTNKNTIQDQASNGLRGLMRLLGSYGAVGSDLGLAGRAVSDEASAQNAGAGQTYAQNQSSLDTNWGNFKNQEENERKKVNDWRSEQLNSARAQSLTTKQDLLSKLAGVNGQLAAARGGSYAGGAQSLLDQANSLSGQIDNLGKINPTYTGTTPQYVQAALESYLTNQAGTSVDPGTQTGGLNTPYLNALLGRDKEKLLA